MENLSINTGHAIMGMSLAPVSGQLITKSLTTFSPCLDLDLLKPERF